jgi:hypothetical protein
MSEAQKEEKQYEQYSIVTPTVILKGYEEKRKNYPTIKEGEKWESFVVEHVTYLWATTLNNEDLEKSMRKTEEEMTAEEGAKIRNIFLLFLDAVGWLYDEKKNEKIIKKKSSNKKA